MSATELIGLVIEAMLKILDVEGAVRRSGNRWQAVPGSDWSYDAEWSGKVPADVMADRRGPDADDY
jgi:hypothetical protein